MTRVPLGVVFDLDGTLVDSRADIAAAVNFTLQQFGLPQHSDEQIGAYVGDGANQLMARAAAKPLNSPDLVPLLATFLEYYAKNSCQRTQLMPGAVESFEALHDLPIALLTNKPRVATLPLLEALDIAKYFRCVVAGGDLSVNKPHPEPLLEIARRLELAPAALVMVGDGPQDIECGRNVGAFTVGITGGIAAPELLIASRPDRLLASLFELAPAIAHWANSDA